MPHADGHPPVPDAKTPRVLELDALRGLAALAVLAFHYTTFYGQEIGHAGPLPFGFPAGNYGVHLFFLISGFVIFMTLERTRTAMDFVVSRFSRLFPAYWAALAVTAAVVYSIGMPGQRLPPGQLALNLTMVQEFLGAEDLDGSYWTLQVELFFYAQMLLWFVLGALRHIRWIIGAWLLLAVVYAGSVQHHLDFSWSARELLIVRHIPFFALGIVFYQVYRRAEWRMSDAAMVGLCLAAIALALPPVFVLVAAVCCAIFGLFVAGRLRWLATPAFAALGAMSYSIYLLHQAIGFAVIHRLEAAGWTAVPAILAATAVCLVLAAALTWGIERPVMRAIRGAWRRRRAPLAIAVGT